MVDYETLEISIHKALAGLDGRGINTAPSDSPISIHKALAGLDKSPYDAVGFHLISIHKALAGLDRCRLLCHKLLIRFQSTRPSRASTPGQG